jgi:hypothetical protein
VRERPKDYQGRRLQSYRIILTCLSSSFHAVVYRRESTLGPFHDPQDPRRCLSLVFRSMYRKASYPLPTFSSPKSLSEKNGLISSIPSHLIIHHQTRPCAKPLHPAIFSAPRKVQSQSKRLARIHQEKISFPNPTTNITAHNQAHPLSFAADKEHAINPNAVFVNSPLLSIYLYRPGEKRRFRGVPEGRTHWIPYALFFPTNQTKPDQTQPNPRPNLT